MNYLLEAENIVKSLENELKTLSNQYSELMEKYEKLSKEYMILSQMRMNEILAMEKLEKSLNEIDSLEASAIEQAKQLTYQNSSLQKQVELLTKQSTASTIVMNKQKEQIESLEQQLKRLTKR